MASSASSSTRTTRRSSSRLRRRASFGVLRRHPSPRGHRSPARSLRPAGWRPTWWLRGSGVSKRYYCVFQGDGAYTSTDGLTWTALTGLPAGGRVALAVSESSPTIAYALKQDGTLWRLVGTGFQSVAGLPPLFAVGGQGWYDISVAVDPANAYIVYVVADLVLDSMNWTLSLFKGPITGGSGTWNFGFNVANTVNPVVDLTYIGRGVHADGHAFAFALNAMGTGHDGASVWVGTDGGFFRSPSSGQTAPSGTAIPGSPSPR